jgi:prepilin-type N-terminal cleavage/methylation domain-containing protein
MRGKGFTLIELLIVVAIIAILAAIAVPNFLEAQVRSKVSRVKADERSAATALEAYCVDYNNYPDTPTTGLAPGYSAYSYLYVQYAAALSTPVAYCTSADFRDPFNDLLVASTWNAPAAPDYRKSLPYFSFTGWWAVGDAVTHVSIPTYFPKKSFALFSNGPCRKWVNCEYVTYVHDTGTPMVISNQLGWHLDVWCDAIYDASNGTKSYGAIARFGGDTRMPQQP